MGFFQSFVGRTRPLLFYPFIRAESGSWAWPAYLAAMVGVGGSGRCEHLQGMEEIPRSQGWKLKEFVRIGRLPTAGACRATDYLVIRCLPVILGRMHARIPDARSSRTSLMLRARCGAL